MSLPHGSGKVLLNFVRDEVVLVFATFVAVRCVNMVCFPQVVRVAYFAEGKHADEARAAGADIVGGAELIEEIASTEPVLFLCIFNLCINFIMVARMFS